MWYHRIKQADSTDRSLINVMPGYGSVYDGIDGAHTEEHDLYRQQFKK